MFRLALRTFTRRVRLPARIGAALAGLRLPERWAVAALAILASMSFYRAHLVDHTYGSYTGCTGCLSASVLEDDALIFCALVALFALARCALSRGARLAIAVLGSAAVLAYLGDILVFRLLSHRLLVADLLHFSGDASRMSGVVMPWLGESEGAIVAVAMLAAVACTWLALAAPPANARANRWLLAAAIAFVPLMELPRAQYVHQIAYFNVWQVNREVDPSRPYSDDFRRHHAGEPAKQLECEAGPALRPSIVLVVVESLSAYHSKLFSGLNDYTPRLDALARRGSYVKTFHANGFSTEGGLIALLTGYVPIPTAGRFGSEMAFTRVAGDFHRWLATQGYYTAFFTTGDLDIGRRRRWLQSIGISYAEGADHPFYRGMPRGSFNAAGDAALVDRFVAWYDRERRQGPFMATLLTVGTHPPFVSPGHGIVGEREVVREADRQVARLADSLRDRGFFRNGVMIIVGDHRAMTPIARSERQVLGDAAEARVMEMALGETGLPPGEVKGDFQQVDVIPSLRHLLARQSCRDEWQGRFLGADPDPPIYVVHSDPLKRNELAVMTGGREYRMVLDGDATAFANAPPRAEADALVARVNYERMSRSPR